MFFFIVFFSISTKNILDSIRLYEKNLKIFSLCKKNLNCKNQNTWKHKYLCDKGRSTALLKILSKDQKSFPEHWPKHLIYKASCILIRFVKIRNFMFLIFLLLSFIKKILIHVIWSQENSIAILVFKGKTMNDWYLEIKVPEQCTSPGLALVLSKVCCGPACC